MDVDSEFDSKLLQQFSSMGTTDKDVLVRELQQLLGDQLNAEGCAFFLDMNNWNLQAAICSYYDFEQPTGKVPCMGLVRDVTIGEGESVPPNTRFTKTWMVQNTGEEAWPPGCCLRFVAGDQLGHIDRVMVDPLDPGCSACVSVEMVSPNDRRLYQGQWRMCTASGMYFGEMIWVIISVEETGLLGVTQQLSKMGSEFSHISAQPASALANPFGSPSKAAGEGPVHETSASSVIANPGSQPSSPFSSPLFPAQQQGVFLNSSLSEASAAMPSMEEDADMS